jgi:integrase/recombinase XerC
LTIDELLRGARIDQERRGLSEGSIAKRHQYLRAFIGSLGDRSIFDVDNRTIEEFLDRRGLCAVTRRAWLSHLHSFYVWAINEDLTEVDPTVRIVRPKLRRRLPRPADSSDLRRALSVANPIMRCWILLAAYQGLRCCEIAGVRRDDITQDPPILRVIGKGDKERSIPLHPVVFEALQSLPMPGGGFVFRRFHGGRYQPEAVSREINSFLHSIGIGSTAHQFRHWFATELYKGTRDLRLVQEVLGHSSPVTTALYTGVDIEGASEAVGRISAGDVSFL